MDNKLIRELNERSRKREILETEDMDITSTLSPEEIGQLVAMAREELKEIGQEANIDMAAEIIGMYLENVPGLEGSFESDKALRVVLDAYKATI